jgi:hypothetical protein
VGCWAIRAFRLLAPLLAILLPAGAARAASVPPPLHYETIGTFTAPIFVSAPLNDLDRVYVVQRAGAIRVVDHGTTLPTPFLDLQGQISTTDERGMLSMAFAPDYATSGRFYVLYTPVDNPSTPDNEFGDIYVDEFRRSTSGNGADTIDAADGERDSIVCGAGVDTTLHDAVDRLAADCES